MFFFDLEPGGNTTFAYTKVEEDNYNILSSDYVLSVNNEGNNWTINLPSPVGLVGKTYIIKRFDNTLMGQITIVPVAGGIQNVFGAFVASAIIGDGSGGTYSDKVMFMSNGTNWEYIL